jgi:hypothetical protein
MKCRWSSAGIGRHRRVAVAGFVVVLLFGAVWQLCQPREPVYQGKTLSAWLDQYSKPRVAAGSQKAVDQDADPATAIRHIGPDGIPYLLEWIGTQDSAMKMLVLTRVNHWQWIGKLIATLGLQKPYENWAFQSTTLPKKAYLGFRILAQEAQPAVPQLVRLIGTTWNQHSRRAAAWSLGAIQSQEALPGLIEYLKDPDEGVREAALQAVYGTSFATLPVTETLRAVFRDRPALKFRSDHSEYLVPGLVQLLTDPKTDAVRVLRLLSDIGPEAEAALPAILPFENSQDPKLRVAAIKVRERIAPGP